jgi:hypothetical protein
MPESVSQVIEIPRNLKIYLKQLCSSSWVLYSISDTFSDFLSFQQKLHVEEISNLEIFSFLMEHLENIARKVDAFFNQSFYNNEGKLNTVSLFLNDF